MAQTLYNRDVLRLAASLVPDDRIEAPDGQAEARSLVCGSQIAAEIVFAEDGTVATLALRANACALGQASAAILRANAVGRNMEQIARIRTGLSTALKDGGEIPDDWPELQQLASARDFPARHAAILLPYDALAAAAENARALYKSVIR